MIDQCYLVSVLDLRDLCRELSNPLEGIDYHLSKPSSDRVLIRFNDDPKDVLNLNALCFAFPIITHVPGLTLLHKQEEAGLMVCLSVYTMTPTQRGFYPDEHGDLKEDHEGDWFRFWQPLAAFLVKEHESL